MSFAPLKEVLLLKVVMPEKLAAPLSRIANAAVPALFSTRKAVVAEVVPAPVTCNRAVGADKEPTANEYLFVVDELKIPI